MEGLRADLRETVPLKQPKGFQEAEEMARLAAVKTNHNKYLYVGFLIFFTSKSEYVKYNK